MAQNRVRVVIDADAKGFERGLKGAASTAKIAAGNIIADLAVKALGAVKDFVGDSIQAFSSLEQSVGGTEAVFGDASGAIDDFAEGSAQAIGLAESDFRTATTLIGGQLKRMTGDVDFAAERSVELTKVAADLAATYGGTTKQAVEALSSAFRGEADPAERFNLDLKIGKVNAKALELGLASATGAIDDQARAQAILALISEQSADAQGQFGREAETAAGKQQRLQAELENTKAAIGEGLMPAYLGLIDGFNNSLPTILNVAEAFMVATGVMNEADAAMRKLERTMGEDFASSAEGLFTAFAQGSENWRSWIAGADEATDAIDGLRDEMEQMSRKELVRARDNLDAVAEAYGWSTEQTEALAAAIDQELNRRMTEADRVFHNNYIPGLDDVADATGGVEEATDDAADAVANFRDEQQQTIDPMFAYRDALRDQEEAQDDVTAAAEEYDEGSPEHLAALEKERLAWQKVKEAEIELATQGGLTKEAFRTQLEAMGIYSKTQIDLIIADFERVNAFKFASKTVRVQADIRGMPGVRTSSRTSFHTGGMFHAPPGEREGWALLKDRETVTRAGQNGNGHGGVTVPIYGNVYGFDDFERKVAEAIEKARRRGVQI